MILYPTYTETIADVNRFVLYFVSGYVLLRMLILRMLILIDTLKNIIEIRKLRRQLEKLEMEKLMNTMKIGRLRQQIEELEKRSEHVDR